MVCVGGAYKACMKKNVSHTHDRDVYSLYMQSLESVICMSHDLRLCWRHSVGCFHQWTLFTNKIISGFAVYFRYNRPNTSRNFDFDANGPAVLENIDRVVGISPTCDATWNITTSGLAVAVFVLPVKGGIANIRIWRNCRASWKTWNVAEISLVPARYDYFRFGDRFYFRYKVMSDGVGITTMEVLHLENVNVALEICSYLSITRCK